MGLNVQHERRKAERQQRRRLIERDQKHNFAVSTPRPAATANGIRQVTSLAKLPTLAKTIEVDVQAGEIRLCWRLKMDDVRALKMMLIHYEANGWKVNDG